VRGGSPASPGGETINAPIGLTARVHFVRDSRRIVASQRNYAICTNGNSRNLTSGCLLQFEPPRQF
jgi:hypothetical protein